MKPDPARSPAFRTRRVAAITGTGLVVPHIVEDCCRALERLGFHPARTVITYLADQPMESVSDDIEKKLREFAPDFILSLDGGVVRELPELFARLGIPVAAWFVDNPTLHITPEKVFDNLFLFVWDRAFVEPLERIGCRVVEYLPLGTNPMRFRRAAPGDPRCERYLCDTSFVGSSLIEQSMLRDRQALKPALREIFEECIERHSVPPHPPMTALLEELETRHELRVTAQDRARLLEGLAIEAMMLYRARALNRLARFRPHVYGDEGWNSLLEDGAEYRGPIDYMTELKFLYGASRINLNLSKSQLKTSVNQRVFDAPAAGGFVLTDYREDVERLFDPDTEIAVFRDLGEMEEKVQYFLENDAERESRARLARRRVLAEHTYGHRMKHMLEVLGEHI